MYIYGKFNGTHGIITVGPYYYDKAVELLSTNADQREAFLEEVRSDPEVSVLLAPAFEALFAMGDDLVVGINGSMFVDALGVQCGFGESLIAAKRIYVDCTP